MSKPKVNNNSKSNLKLRSTSNIRLDHHISRHHVTKESPVHRKFVSAPSQPLKCAIRKNFAVAPRDGVSVCTRVQTDYLYEITYSQNHLEQFRNKRFFLQFNCMTCEVQSTFQDIFGFCPALIILDYSFLQKRSCRLWVPSRFTS